MTPHQPQHDVSTAKASPCKKLAIVGSRGYKVGCLSHSGSRKRRSSYELPRIKIYQDVLPTATFSSSHSQNFPRRFSSSRLIEVPPLRLLASRKSVIPRVIRPSPFLGLIDDQFIGNFSRHFEALKEFHRVFYLNFQARKQRLIDSFKLVC